jgi:quercetin dioxygenase-like cupin family protein
MTAVVHGPGEGERLAVGPSSTVIKADGAATDGRFFLSETEIAPGFGGPPLHTHEKLMDMFYVLDGTLTLVVEDETIEAEPGTFACIPPGTRHSFSNRTDAPVRFLNFNTPSGWENYMRDLAAAGAKGPLSPQEIGEIASRYDFTVAR